MAPHSLFQRKFMDRAGMLGEDWANADLGID
jgi:hypothetical protein